MSVQNLIDNAKTYVTDVTGQAREAMTTALGKAGELSIFIPSPIAPTFPVAPTAGAALTPPTLSDITLDLPTDPGSAPTYQDIAAIGDAAPSAFAVVAPVFTAPNRPSEAAAFNVSSPNLVTSFAFPVAPDALTAASFDPPTLPDRLEPSKPQVSLPVFDALTPVDNTVAPTNLEGQFDAAYRSAAPSTIAMVNGYVDAMLAKYNPRYTEQMGRIEDQLATYLNGGTGFKPEVEDAIYARALEKNDAEAQRVRDAAYSEAASRGFTLPNGALTAAVARARQQGANNNAAAAREIVVLQAEMEQKNLQFAVTTSVGLRTMMLNASLSYMQNLASLNGQALEYAKSVLGAVVETYNITVKAFASKLDAYKAEAVVYETRLKSALAGVELYQAEIKALESLTNVDKARVDVYRARIDTLNVYANVYKAQIDAVLGRASLEKMKIDLYQAQVQAYGTLVQAKGAEWGGYVAQINGERAKQDAYASQVQGYSAQIQGFKALIEAKSENVRAQAATNEARSRQYAATVSAFSAVVQAKGAKANVQLENQRQQLVSFQAQATANTAYAQTQSEFYKSTSMVAIEKAKMQLSADTVMQNSMVVRGQALSQVATANAKIFAGLAGAALSGMNTLASESLAQ